MLARWDQKAISQRRPRHCDANHATAKSHRPASTEQLLPRRRMRWETGCAVLAGEFLRETSNEPALAAALQPEDQGFGKARRCHALLHCLYIVGNAPEFHNFVVDVCDRERCARVPIARLADGARIQQVGGTWLDLERREFIFALRLEVQYANPVVLTPEREPALQMGMTKKSDRGRSLNQAVEGLRRSAHVFVLAARRTVNDGKTVDRCRSSRQFFEIFTKFRTQLIACPEGGIAGDGIEIFGVGQAASGFVVVAANCDRVNFADAVDYFVRVGSVADDVTQAHGFFPLAFGGSERGVERREVGVNVAEN